MPSVLAAPPSILTLMWYYTPPALLLQIQVLNLHALYSRMCACGVQQPTCLQILNSMFCITLLLLSLLSVWLSCSGLVMWYMQHARCVTYVWLSLLGLIISWGL